jgi:SAM-dependent methyltransferase
LPDISTAYHLEELRIARDPADPRRVLPAGLDKYERILDVGCGAGQTLIAAQLVGRAVGVDLDLSALVLGRQLDRGLRLTCARGEDLPLRSDYFDLVMCRVALPYMHTGRAVAEMWRVLRTDGMVWLLLHPASLIFRELAGNLAQFQFKAAIHRLYVIINGLASHLVGTEFRWPLSGHHESFQTAKSIRTALRRAGFDEIAIGRSPFIVIAARKRSSQPRASGMPNN